jgi:hypothetical protein
VAQQGLKKACLFLLGPSENVSPKKSQGNGCILLRINASAIEEVWQVPRRIKLNPHREHRKPQTSKSKVLACEKDRLPTREKSRWESSQHCL